MMNYEPRSLNPNIMEKRVNDLSKAVGGGGIGTIPIASADTVGGVMIGGSANPITITGSGNASVRKATAELLGVVKAGDGVSIDAEGSISGVPYSTTEHKTGRKWIDGADIYEKTLYIENGISIDTSGTTIESNTAVNIIVDIWVSDGIHGYAPVQGTVESSELRVLAITGTLVSIKYVTYRYTKSITP